MLAYSTIDSVLDCTPYDRVEALETRPKRARNAPETRPKRARNAPETRPKRARISWGTVYGSGVTMTRDRKRDVSTVSAGAECEHKVPVRWPSVKAVLESRGDESALQETAAQR